MHGSPHLFFADTAESLGSGIYFYLLLVMVIFPDSIPLDAGIAVWLGHRIEIACHTDLLTFKYSGLKISLLYFKIPLCG